VTEVVVERDIAAPPEVVFSMFTQPHLLVRWLGDTAELDPVPGGVFRFSVGDQDACVGRYVALDPPRRLVFTWGWERAEAIPVPAGLKRLYGVEHALQSGAGDLHGNEGRQHHCLHHWLRGWHDGRRV
jgi:uncharacterized protein YndB with AHSA1/START domain